MLTMAMTMTLTGESIRAIVMPQGSPRPMSNVQIAGCHCNPSAEIGQQALAPFSNKFSKHDFMQAQLFAIPVGSPI
jgi:hypothetical protein